MPAWLKNWWARKTEGFFCAAVSALAYESDERAGVAAWLAASEVDADTAARYVRYIGWIAGLIKEPNPLLGDLAVLISNLNSNGEDSKRIMEALQKLDHECLRFYRGRDPRVFHRRYPNLIVLSMAEMQKTSDETTALIDDPAFHEALAATDPDLYQRLTTEGLIELKPDAKNPK